MPDILFFWHLLQQRYKHTFSPPSPSPLWAVLYLVTQSCPWTPGCSMPGFSIHGDSPDKNIGVGCHALLQGIFPTQGLNSGLPYCRMILYCLNHRGSWRILEWVAYPLSRGSSQSKNWTRSPALQVDSLPAELPGKLPWWLLWQRIPLLLPNKLNFAGHWSSL